MCPICVTSSSNGGRSRFVLLADHIATVHDDGTMAHDDDGIQSSSLSQTRRGEHEEEDSDEDDDDDDEAALNDLEHRAFIEEEHRRQEAARQRLAQASSLAAVMRNEYASALSGNANTQRRPLSRQTAIRGHRGGLRGHFHNYPYGVVPRSFTGFTSNTFTRPSSDSTTTNSTQNPLSNDPYATFAQDPMLEFVSRLVSNQSSSSSSTAPTVSTSNGQFLFAPSIPVQMPSSTATSADLTRLQQQLDNGESMIQIKTSLLNGKQKRSSHNPSSTSSQSIMLSHLSGSGFDYELWQQQFPALQPTYNNLNFFTGNISTDLTIGNSNNSSLKHSQQFNREYDPRSLLGKIIRNEQGVNNGETNETHTNQQQDHIAYLQSILVSTMITNFNED